MHKVTSSDWVPAYIGLGANLNDPVTQVRRALDELRGIAGVRYVAASHLYKNPPMGPQDQPDYVNAVAGVLTTLAPQVLLETLQKLEHRLGRVRTTGDRWGPRVIDLDLLVYGTSELAEPGLNLPHSGISERNFVLLPLCDIAPLLNVPGQGTVQTLAQGFGGGELERIEA
ncbi:MAG: 2-amino-4-hydroxy-6-hydroxymethyldihydropteridine diphosphokinase [Gammaproteobacteria bacterium]